MVIVLHIVGVATLSRKKSHREEGLGKTFTKPESIFLCSVRINATLPQCAFIEIFRAWPHLWQVVMKRRVTFQKKTAKMG